MKITPLEIRQKTFERKLRGYDKEDVDAFLQSLSQEWERLLSEKKELQLKFQNAEQDVRKLREVESTLYKTLKTAEETGANIIDQANRSSELQVREAQMNAEAILNDARHKAQAMLEEADEVVRKNIGRVREELKDMEMDFHRIESQRENMLNELRNIANDTFDKVQKMEAKKSNYELTKIPEIPRIEFDSEKYQVMKPDPLPEIKLKKEEIPKPVTKSDTADTDQKQQPADEPVSHEKEQKQKKTENKDEGSFFDQI